MKRCAFVMFALLLSTVNCMAEGDGVRSEWRFVKGDDYKPANQFVKTGVYPSSVGVASEIRFVSGKKGSAKPRFSLRNGRPEVSGSSAGDYWLFSMPTEGLVAGTAVDFYAQFIAQPAKGEYPFVLEYRDGKKWLPAMPETASDGRNCESTLSAKHPCRLLATVRLSKEVKRGRSVEFRLRQLTSGPSSVTLTGFKAGQYPQIICYDNTIPRDTVKVLFIGNSYTYYNTYPVIFKEIAWREGHYADCNMFVRGRYYVRKHLETPECRNVVNVGGYDYAFVQDNSFNPLIAGVEKSRQPIDDVTEMFDLIRKKSPEVKPVLEIVWCRKNGAHDIPKKYEYMVGKYPEVFADYASMQQNVIEGTYLMARETGAQTSPVGVAWQIVRRERPDVELYDPDARHPSYAGSYLSAAVAYLTIYKTPFGDNPANVRLDAETASYLRSVAERVVLRGEK